MNKGYFKTEPGEPAPLKKLVRRTVRFEEVDAMNIVWHGRYASYFEDARVALGDSVGLGYLDYYNNGVMTPIKKLQIDYVKPLTYGDYFSIEAIMHWTEAARINMEFILRNQSDEVVTTGYSIQLMLDTEGELFLGAPPCHLRLQERWRTGELSHLKTGWAPKAPHYK
jgi:acyl-CoA thioester hydrolase